MVFKVRPVLFGERGGFSRANAYTTCKIGGMSYGQIDNSLLARARRASTDAEKLALYFELVSALAGHERREREQEARPA